MAELNLEKKPHFIYGRVLVPKIKIYVWKFGQITAYFGHERLKKRSNGKLLDTGGYFLPGTYILKLFFSIGHYVMKLSLWKVKPILLKRNVHISVDIFLMIEFQAVNSFSHNNNNGFKKYIRWQVKKENGLITFHWEYEKIIFLGSLYYGIRMTENCKNNLCNKPYYLRYQITLAPS